MLTAKVIQILTVRDQHEFNGVRFFGTSCKLILGLQYIYANFNAQSPSKFH